MCTVVGANFMVTPSIADAPQNFQRVTEPHIPLVPTLRFGIGNGHGVLVVIVVVLVAVVNSLQQQ